MPEAPNDTTWACVRRPAGCPDAVPASGERCRHEGLSCGYGTCGGASIVCRSGAWEVITYDPPPSAEF
ncbi:MAG: hypothetical protein KC501_14845 [Myxococcales bacterium]|nr:hypothetical protein [Myxococcales bacterium]